MPSKKKKYNARFPAGRIKKIMQTDEEVGKVAQAVPVIISRTLELFVESLLMKALEVTLAKNAKTLSPSHLKQCILAESRFDFLKDLVKNIPDVSQSDEKETPSGNWSVDNPPNTPQPSETTNSRVPLPHPSTSSTPRPRIQSGKRENGQSSDSGSDYEPPAKRNQRLHFGNGRTQHPPAPAPPPPPIITPAASSDVSTSSLTPTSTNNRLPNFYTETLKENEEEEAPSSVIQLNPEYASSPSSSGFGFYRQSSTVTSLGPKKQPPPKLHIDLTNSVASPVFKIDLSAMPLSADSSAVSALSFTPTLVNSPHTPIIQSPFSRPPSSGRKRSCTNEPPPLLPITPIKVSSASSVAKIPNSSKQPDEDYDT